MTGATRRVNSISPKPAGVISGSTSNCTENSRSWPSSNFTSSILGCIAGFTARSLSAAWVDSSMVRSRDSSPRTAWPKRLRSRFMGTLPGRKPGRRTCWPTSLRRLVTLFFDGGSRDDDVEFALQTVGALIGDLHGSWRPLVNSFGIGSFDDSGPAIRTAGRRKTRRRLGGGAGEGI